MANGNKRSRVRRFVRRIRNGTLTFDQVFRSFNGVFNRPAALVLIIIGIVLAVSVKTQPSVGAKTIKTDTTTYNTEWNILDKLLFKTKSNTAIVNTTTWMTQNPTKVIGSIWLSAAVIASAPKSYTLPLIFGVVLFTVVVSSASYSEYVLQSVLIFLLFKQRQPMARLFILVVIILLYLSEYLLKHVTI